MVFNWKWLVAAIIIFAAVSSSNRAYGKWIFALVMIGILLKFGDKVLPKFNGV
jgi:uncharacterized membrane protein